MVVDIQGDDVYTDLQIHTLAGTDYGDGNLGVGWRSSQRPNTTPIVSDLACCASPSRRRRRASKNSRRSTAMPPRMTPPHLCQRRRSQRGSGGCDGVSAVGCGRARQLAPGRELQPAARGREGAALPLVDRRCSGQGESDQRPPVGALRCARARGESSTRLWRRRSCTTGTGRARRGGGPKS